jgi:predicted nicotinamide N-methyase
MTDGGEGALRARYEVREECFEHGGWGVELILPRAADALIDEAEFDADERLPYWADLWPSARALARHLLDAGVVGGGTALELGCGVALPSLVLREQGVDVLATDWYAEALRFAGANAHRNRLAPLRTALLDWRHPPTERGAFTRIVAADVLYEARNSALLAELLPRLAAPGAGVLLADPGRVHVPAFLERMRALGWEPEQVDERREPSAAGAWSRVAIWSLSAP